MGSANGTGSEMKKVEDEFAQLHALAGGACEKF